MSPRSPPASCQDIKNVKSKQIKQRQQHLLSTTTDHKKHCSYTTKEVRVVANLSLSRRRTLLQCRAVCLPPMILTPSLFLSLSIGRSLTHRLVYKKQKINRIMINLFVPLLLAVTSSRVHSFPARYSCFEDEYEEQYQSFKVVRQEWDHALDPDPSIVKKGVHTLHSQELVDEDSPLCVQDAAAVFDEFTKVVFKEDHPFVASTNEVFGKDDAHCYQSALLILDEVRTAGGEKVPLNTIESFKAKKKDDIVERCNGGRQVALSNLANFKLPKNLEDGTVLIYSLIISINGPDCCETAHPLPLMHGQFEVVLGENTETASADNDKPSKVTGGFLRVQSFKASEDEDLPDETVSQVRRKLYCFEGPP